MTRRWWRSVKPHLSGSVRVVIILVALLAVVAMSLIAGLTSKNTNQPGSHAGSSITNRPVSVSPTLATVSTDSQAYSELVRRADEGWTATQPLTGQWVAQLGSAVVVSPGQPTPSPSGITPVSAPPDALASFEAARRDDSGEGHDVRLLRRSTFNPPAIDDRFTFVTIVSGNFSNADEVTSWCAGRSQAASASGCAPLQLLPR